MGESVWLFMWLIDKMTSTSEDGVGLVLGGKPVKYEDVNGDLDISNKTYRRYVATLKEHGYISITHAPYGIVFRVNKAKKSFGKRSVESDRSAISDRPDRSHMTDLPDKSDRPNKTVSVDNTVRPSKEGAEAHGNPQVNEVWEHFQTVYRLKIESNIPTNRRAAQTILLRCRRNLAEKRGIDRADVPNEAVMNAAKFIIDAAAMAASSKYSKTKPRSLREIVSEWDNLKVFVLTKKSMDKDDKQFVGKVPQ